MKRVKILLSIPLLFVTLLLVWAVARSSDSDPNGEYPLITTISIPGGLNSFDISWADSASGRYYLADRTTGPGGRIDVIDAESNSFLYFIPGFVGNIGRNLSGPNGIVVVHKGNDHFGDDDDRGRSELWGGMAYLPAARAR